MTANACQDPPGRTRRTWVVNQILNAIFTGEFRGGDRLVEQEIAASIGVSRTPIREAFGELASIGLIGVRPNHGAVVRPFGPTQIREIYHIRLLLESEAARCANGRIAPSDLKQIRQKTQDHLARPRSAEWTAAAVELDQEFHELIASHCGCTRLTEEIGRYRGLIQSIRLAVGNKGHAQEVAITEHTNVVDRLLESNAEGAADAMTDHIRRGTEAAVTALFTRPVEVTITNFAATAVPQT
jgi:DNA-binding GntR family transcriptional regulator